MGRSLRYELIDVLPGEFTRAVREFFTAGGRGLNVTVPHKAAAAALADRLLEPARLAGAANTLACDATGRVTATNTDGAGLLRDLGVNHGLDLEAKRILLAGAGGAARGVLAPLLEARPTELVIANRTAEKGASLAAEFSPLGSVQAQTYEALSGRFALLINAPSASLCGEVPPVPAGSLSADTVCYDMAYAPEQTAFQQWAYANGARVALQGWGMLVEQAAEAFLFWHGMRPDTGPVLKALRRK